MKQYKEGDTIKFKIGSKIYTGKVSNSFVTIYDHDNDIIFKKLGIENQYYFCSKYYGYEVTSGCWPSYKYDDFEAASKVINALLELCDKYNSTEDDSEWKVGGKLQYITDDHCFNGFQDCTINSIYTICKIHEDSDVSFKDDKNDFCIILQRERNVFKKIINNQTTTNYVKDNSIELSATFATISARETARGSAIYSPNIQICI